MRHDADAAVPNPLKHRIVGDVQAVVPNHALQRVNVSLATLRVTNEAVRQHCRERLAAYKVPTEFRVEHELPKNASGKILKRELRLVP